MYLNGFLVSYGKFQYLPIVFKWHNKLHKCFEVDPDRMTILKL